MEINLINKHTLTLTRVWKDLNRGSSFCACTSRLPTLGKRRFLTGALARIHLRGRKQKRHLGTRAHFANDPIFLGTQFRPALAWVQLLTQKAALENMECVFSAPEQVIERSLLTAIFHGTAKSCLFSVGRRAEAQRVQAACCRGYRLS